MTSAQPALTLGLDGFTYPDLHDPLRLRDLYDLFCRRVEAADPQLWSAWDAYRADPDAPRPATERSDLLVRMSPHVSRFVVELFRVEEAAAGVARSTASLDALFRFKADFVRKRALPLVKGGARVTLDPADADIVRALAEPWAATGDHELAIAIAGCALLDRENEVRASGTDEEKAALTAQIEAMKRWCAACLHDPGYRPWVIFKFPETLDYFNLVHVQRSKDLPQAMFGPDDRLRRRDGFKLTDARANEREILSEIHYCVLCHERDKDSCSKGIRDAKAAVEGQKAPALVNALGIELNG